MYTLFCILSSKKILVSTGSGKSETEHSDQMVFEPFENFQQRKQGLI